MSNHTTNYLALEAFAAANARSMGARSRFQFGDLMVYARIAARWIDGEGRWTLDLADLEVTNEGERGQGYFTHFLSNAERIADSNGLIVYVQSIVNQRLLNSLVAKGYFLQGYDAYRLHQAPPRP
ncbi:hypothetical protein NK639_28230 [Pseudomonas sp. ZM24]|uniref:hypothetical protein n=1 Tax=Pseudomonas triclosanedens TaxID=2961893 RepID=UPI0020C32F0A|nr:hypothetical protein [Pseudomonas triclosanedens]MCP8472877.1 hypothetical protein [Pseudomonas triclosanedens]MCP8479447.1 hypothetical protein [Pseudomonas triclosanedens]